MHEKITLISAARSRLRKFWLNDRNVLLGFFVDVLSRWLKQILKIEEDQEDQEVEFEIFY